MDECDAAGQCTTCGPTWATLQGNGLDTAHLFDEASVLVAGRLGSSGMAARISTCNGEVLDSLLLSSDSAELVVTAASSAGDAWSIAGNLVPDPPGARQTFYAGLDFDSLTSEDLLFLPAELEDVRSVIDVGNGALWFGGAVFPDGTIPLPRYAYLNAKDPESMCSLSLLGDAERGTVRPGFERDGLIYLGGTYSGSAFVARFDPTQCPIDSCACTPDLFIPLYPTVASGVWDMRFAGDTLYAVGYRTSEAGESLEGFIARVSLVEESITDEWRWNPTTRDDVIRSVWIQEDTLYVAALTDRDDPVEQGAAAVVALSPDLAAGPLWTEYPPQLTDPTSVVATQNAVFVSGRNTDLDQGWVMRCTTDGLCPE